MAQQGGIDPAALVEVIDKKHQQVKSLLGEIQNNADEISIKDSFELMYQTQMLTATIESSSSFLTAMHQALRSVASGIKGH